MDSITILTWVIGLGGGAFAILMGVMWSFILRGQQNLYTFVTSIQKDLKEEIDMLNKQSREDSREFDSRYARKDEVVEVRNTVNAMRGEMSTQFGAINTHIGSVTAQLASIVSLMSKGLKNE